MFLYGDKGYFKIAKCEKECFLKNESFNTVKFNIFEHNWYQIDAYTLNLVNYAIYFHFNHNKVVFKAIEFHCLSYVKSMGKICKISFFDAEFQGLKLVRNLSKNDAKTFFVLYFT